MIIDSCTKAIEVGKVTGTVENPVLENVSADKIHKALDSTKGMLRITSSAKAWTYACMMLKTYVVI